MTSKTEVYAASELEQVAHLFDHWRHHRATRTAPMPHLLWQQAVTLTTRLPLRLVAKRLGLNSTTLQQQCAARHGVPIPEATATARGFVAVTLPPAWPLPTPTTEIELQRTDGTRLRMHCREPQVPLVALIRTFLETR